MACLLQQPEAKQATLESTSEGSLSQLHVCTAVPLQGPRMVRDVFRLAKENAPSIIFIDEVDAIATARFDAQVSPPARPHMGATHGWYALRVVVPQLRSVADAALLHCVAP